MEQRRVRTYNDNYGGMKGRIIEKGEMIGHCKRITLNSNFLTMAVILIEYLNV